MRKRSSLVTENVVFFPEEILYEILSWLGVKSLLRCKSVCKIWYAVIKNKQFVDMHAVRNGHRFYKIKRRGKSLNSMGIREKIRHLCISCGGFLLVERKSLVSAMPSAIYRISNPTTKRILDLPPPRNRVIGMCVFLNYSTSSYNVVSLYLENKKANLELIDLGGQSNDPCPDADLSWRTINISEFDKVSRQQGFHLKYCMSSEGILYFLALPIVLQSSNAKILCVDLVKQACTTLNPPQSLRCNWYLVVFRLWKGKPSVFFVLEENLNVWVLEDYKKQKWAVTIVIPLPFLKQDPSMQVIPKIYEGDEEDFLVYRKDRRSCLVYKLESKEWCTAPYPPEMVPATLVSVKGMQPEKKEH